LADSCGSFLLEGNVDYLLSKRLVSRLKGTSRLKNVLRLESFSRLESVLGLESVLRLERRGSSSGPAV
jgi:hypothetical protein